MNPLGLFGIVPLWAWGLAGAIAWGGFGHWKASRVRDAWDTEKRTQAAAYAKGLDKVHEEHTAKLLKREEAIHEGSKQIELERVRADREHAVVVGLRDLIPAAVRAAAGNAPSVAASAAAGGLGDVSRQCVGTVEEMARRTRAILIAHRQCAAEYEAMRQRKAP